jgi:hypothetical protein
VIEDRHTDVPDVGRQLRRVRWKLVRHRKVDEEIDARREKGLNALAYRGNTRRTGIFPSEQLAGIHPVGIWKRRIGFDHGGDELIRSL